MRHHDVRQAYYFGRLARKRCIFHAATMDFPFLGTCQVDPCVYEYKTGPLVNQLPVSGFFDLWCLVVGLFFMSNALPCGFCTGRGPLLEHRAPPMIAGRRGMNLQSLSALVVLLWQERRNFARSHLHLYRIESVMGAWRVSNSGA